MLAGWADIGLRLLIGTFFLTKPVVLFDGVENWTSMVLNNMLSQYKTSGVMVLNNRLEKLVFSGTISRYIWVEFREIFTDLSNLYATYFMLVMAARELAQSTDY